METVYHVAVGQHFWFWIPGCSDPAFTLYQYTARILEFIADHSPPHQYCSMVRPASFHSSHFFMDTCCTAWNVIGIIDDQIYPGQYLGLSG